MKRPYIFILTGRKGIEPVITDELGYFVAALHNTNGSPFDPLDLLTQGVSNIITRVVFGDRFDYSDEKLSNLQFQNYIAILIKTRSLQLLRVSILNFNFSPVVSLNGKSFSVLGKKWWAYSLFCSIFPDLDLYHH